MKKLHLLILAILTLSVNSEAQNFKSANLDSLMNGLEQNNKFNGSLAFSHQGRVLYKKAIGFSDIEAGVKVSTKTKYWIGSITKMFNATLVFKAIEENKLDLNQRIDTNPVLDDLI